MPKKLRDEGVPRPPFTKILRKKIPMWAENGVFTLYNVKSGLLEKYIKKIKNTVFGPKIPDFL